MVSLMESTSNESLYRDDDKGSESLNPSGTYSTIDKALSECRLLTAEGERTLFKRMNFLDTRAEAIESTLSTKRPAKKSLKEIDKLKAQSAAVREELAVANLRLVASIANRLSNSKDDFDNYFSEGSSILLYAISKFDYSRGFRFSTYATHAIQRHLYRVIQKESKQAVNLPDENIEFFESGAPRKQEAPEYRSEQAEPFTAEVLSRIDDILDEREKMIVRGRFGLDGTGEEKTYQVLGDALGLSKEGARQLFNRALDKLNKDLKPIEEEMMDS